MLTGFYVLATTAENYLSPSLSRISKRLGISESLAGVTLLAFSNGAPDVISSISAGSSFDAVPLIIGALFGGGIFVTTLVAGTVIYSSKNGIKV